MTYLPVDVTIDQKAKERHRVETLNLLAYVSLLVLVLVTTWFLKRRKRLYLHETGLAIIYGLVMGALLRYFGLDVRISSAQLNSTIPLSVPADYVTIEARVLGEKNQSHVYAYEFRGEIQRDAKLGSQISYASVDPEVFFNIILPPIVLNAGLSLKRRHFFRNIGAIFSYAFIGTTISVATVGSLIYGSVNLLKIWFNNSYLADRFTLANCLYFGAIISPTDPLAVLSIFQELGVDVNLFALVFGESILNDAVSIVLTHSIGHFSLIYERDLYYSLLSIIWQCVSAFMSMFFISCFIGIALGIITALTTKFTKLTESPLLESSLVVLMSYSSFLTAEVIDASGIVAILFCGITQAHYTINNLSFEARERLKNLFELLTFLCENFLFLAVGVCFWQRGQTWDLSFVGIAFLSITVARALSVYPLTVLLNLGRRKKIPANYQHLIAWGGAARGVISYSLAARNTIGDARQIMLSTTSVVVIVTVIAVGSFVGRLLKCLKIASSLEPLTGKHACRADGFADELCDCEDEHQASVSTTNNPNWIVRPKRLSCRRSANSGDCVASVCSRATVCGKPGLITCPRSHQLNSQPVAHCFHNQRRHNNHFSPESTPVLEIETLHSSRTQHWPTATSSVCSLDHLYEANVLSPGLLGPLPEADQSSTNCGSGNAGESTTSSCAALDAGQGRASTAESVTSLEAPANAIGRPHGAAYENASFVRLWRSIDNKFIKPLLTNSQPTLLDTMPKSLKPFARLFTSEEQLMRQC